MSDSGFSGLPPGSRGGDISFPQSIIELKAKIIELRGELKAARVRQQLEGEIVSNNKDGTTTIRTDKGEVTVKFPPRERPPEGTRVELDIPPGTPPRQLTVRPAPQQPAPTVPAEPTPPPRPATTQKPEQAQPVPRLDIQTAEDLARHIESIPPEQRPQITVRPDDIIRLVPLSAAQAQDVIIPPFEVLTGQVTPLPAAPQIKLPDALFAAVKQLVTATPAEPQLILHSLPTQLPLHTQATQNPFSGYNLTEENIPSFSVAAGLLRHILHATPLGRITVPPLHLLPQTPESILPDSVTPFAALKKFSSLPLHLPHVKSTAINSAFLTTAITEDGKTDFSVFSTKKAFDARVQSVSEPQLQLVDPQTKVPITHAGLKLIASASHHAIDVLHLPTAQAGTITGTVTGLTPQSLPVLSLSLPGVPQPQNFVMPFEAKNLPPGTQVKIMPLLGGSAASPNTGLGPFVPLEFFSTFDWPAMQDLAQTLQHAAPQSAQLLNNVVANAATPARIPAAALFFFAAVSAGDMSSWLGDKTVETLRRLGKGDLLEKLSRDAGGLQRSGGEHGRADWRATALPMMWDGNMHKMMLYYRHDRDHNTDEEDGKRGTRFIFDLNLDRLGDVQLDGLHRPQHGKKGKLDLIVRSKKPFSTSMQQAMRRTYVGALEQTDMTGELSFQNKAEQFIKVDMQQQQGSGATV